MPFPSKLSTSLFLDEVPTIGSREEEHNNKEILFDVTTVGNPNCQYVYGIDPASERDNFSIIILPNYNSNEILSKWNEPNFYDKLFIGKKLNVINSESNDGVYTTKNNNIIDLIHFEYSTNPILLGTYSLMIEVVSKSDLPKIFDGSL